MKIARSNEIDYSKSILASPEYLMSLNGVADYGYLVDGKYVLPYVIRKKMFFHWVQLDSDIIVTSGTASLEDIQKFYDDAMCFIRNNMKVSHVVTSNTAIAECYPRDSFFCKFGSYVVDLEKTEDELFKGLHSKHRNVVRKAMTDGIQVYHGSDCAHDTISLMQDTFSRQNKVSGLGNYLIKQMEPLGENADYWIAKDAEGNLQGSAIFLWSRGGTCYYMHGGSAAHTKPGAMNLLIWEAMKCMKERGVKTFDFVGARLTTEPGSKLEGIQRFKSRFGATMKVGYMFRVVINKPYYWLYKLATSVAYLALQHKLPKDVIKEERLKGNM